MFQTDNEWPENFQVGSRKMRMRAQNWREI